MHHEINCKPFACHGKSHSQKIFVIDFLINILAANACIVVFFCRNIDVSSFFNDRKLALESLTRFLAGLNSIYYLIVINILK